MFSEAASAPAHPPTSDISVAAHLGAAAAAAFPTTRVAPPAEADEGGMGHLTGSQSLHSASRKARSQL